MDPSSPHYEFIITSGNSHPWVFPPLGVLRPVEILSSWNLIFFVNLY